MKKGYLSICLILISVSCFAQAPDWAWAKSAGGAKYDASNSVAVNTSGNAYATGVFISPAINFDNITLTNADNTGYYQDIFLTKYDINGNVLWAKSVGGIANDESYSITLDNTGNIFIAGGFKSQNILFDSINLVNEGDYDIFFAKYDDFGNIIWAKSIGSTNDERSTEIKVDEYGNIFLIGYFNSPSLTFGTDTLTNAGSYDFFIAKFDVNGNSLWAKSVGGSYDEFISSFALDALGNIYATGYFFNSSITFDSITLTNAGEHDIFLVKYDTSGNVVWAKSAGGIGSDVVNTIALDTSSNIYLTGFFNSPTLTFGSTTLINTLLSDIFVFKYNNCGNEVWAKSAGGLSLDYAHSVIVDELGNLYVAGEFLSPYITFGSITLTNSDTISSNTGDIYITKYDSNVGVIWVKSAGGTNIDALYSIAIDVSQNIYLAGKFGSTTINFGLTTLINEGNADVFIAKLSSVTGINELSNSLNISIFPNPSSDNFSIIIPEKAIIEIFNINGQIVKTINNAEKETTVDISYFSNGVYIIRAMTDKEIVTKKFIKD